MEKVQESAKAALATADFEPENRAAATFADDAA